MLRGWNFDRCPHYIIPVYEPKTPSFSQTRCYVISTTNLVHKPSSWYKQQHVNSSYKSVRQGDYRGTPAYNANTPSNDPHVQQKRCATMYVQLQKKDRDRDAHNKKIRPNSRKVPGNQSHTHIHTYTHGQRPMKLSVCIRYTVRP